jgi:hypothetical protein
LGRPEWGVCAFSFTLRVKQKASWLLAIDSALIAAYVFNAHNPKIAADGRLANLDHREDKQTVDSPVLVIHSEETRLSLGAWVQISPATCGGWGAEVARRWRTNVRF